MISIAYDLARGVNRPPIAFDPVVCDEDFSELETEEADQIWTNCYDTAERIAYIRAHRHHFEFRNFADLLGCVRGRYFSGYASELID
jgi:hypothetical protein